jgi:hypothetical protein
MCLHVVGSLNIPHIQKINVGPTNSYFRNAIVQTIELGHNHCSTKAKITVANGTVAFSHI